MQLFHAAAELLLREALEGLHSTLGGRHPNTLSSINNLGSLLQGNGDLAAVELLLREALEGMCETLGRRHPTTLICINNLELVLFKASRVARWTQCIIL